MADYRTPLAGVPPTAKGTRSLQRLMERFRISEVPASLHSLAASESGIHDLHMNLSRHLAEGKVSEATKLLVAIAVASTLASPDAVALFSAAAIAAGEPPQDVIEAIGVATTCTVFNGYYRFRHQVPTQWKPTYDAFRAPFNGNTFMKCRLEGLTVEGICIVVSSVNNCHACVETHVQKGRSLGLTDEMIDELIRAGAVAAGAAGALAGLAPVAMAPDPGATSA